MNLLPALFVLAVLVNSAWAQEVPKLIGRVNDYAGVLSPEARQELEIKLADHERATTNQVVILTMPSLGNFPDLATLAQKAGEKWQIGQKGKDNGVIILMIKDRLDKARAVRVHPGYGLEGALPDAVCYRIAAEMKELFQSGKYHEGFDTGLSQILSRIEKESLAKPSRTPDENLAILLVLAVIIGGIMFMAWLFVRPERKRIEKSFRDLASHPSIPQVYRTEVPYGRRRAPSRPSSSSQRSSSSSSSSTASYTPAADFTSDWSSGSLSSSSSDFSGGGGSFGGAGGEA